MVDAAAKQAVADAAAGAGAGGMSSPRRHWQVGPAKVVVRASPRPTVPNVNHHELHSNIAPQQPTLDLTTIQQHELKESVEGLRQRLLQAEARISLQTHALLAFPPQETTCAQVDLRLLRGLQRAVGDQPSLVGRPFRTRPVTLRDATR